MASLEKPSPFTNDASSENYKVPDNDNTSAEELLEPNAIDTEREIDKLSGRAEYSIEPQPAELKSAEEEIIQMEKKAQDLRGAAKREVKDMARGEEMRPEIKAYIRQAVAESSPEMSPEDQRLVKNYLEVIEDDLSSAEQEQGNMWQRMKAGVRKPFTRMQVVNEELPERLAGKQTLKEIAQEWRGDLAQPFKAIKAIFSKKDQEKVIKARQLVVDAMRTKVDRDNAVIQQDIDNNPFWSEKEGRATNQPYANEVLTEMADQCERLNDTERVYAMRKQGKSGVRRALERPLEIIQAKKVNQQEIDLLSHNRVLEKMDDKVNELRAYVDNEKPEDPLWEKYYQFAAEEVKNVKKEHPPGTLNPGDEKEIIIKVREKARFKAEADQRRQKIVDAISQQIDKLAEANANINTTKKDKERRKKQRKNLSLAKKELLQEPLESFLPGTEQAIIDNVNRRAKGEDVELIPPEVDITLNEKSNLDLDNANDNIAYELLEDYKHQRKELYNDLQKLSDDQFGRKYNNSKDRYKNRLQELDKKINDLTGKFYNSGSMAA